MKYHWLFQKLLQQEFQIAITNEILTEYTVVNRETVIRLCQEKDVEAIIEVWHQASVMAHPFLTETFLQEERTKLREVFLPNSMTWVYEAAGRVVGFISLVDNEVGGLFVRPSQQRQGIGQALMDKACSLHDVLELDVFAANKIGRAFYAKYGFVPISQYEEEQTGEMMVRLRYELGKDAREISRKTSK